MKRVLTVAAAWLPATSFVLALLFLAFVWGAAAVYYRVFPYRTVNWIAAGIESYGEMEPLDWPWHTIRLIDEDAGIDPVEVLGPGAPDTHIVMAGGFFYRPDICPDFGCIAWVMTREGEVLHSWEVDPSGLFDAETLSAHTGHRVPKNIGVQGVALAPDGDLVVTFQTRNIFPYQVGVARFAWDGSLEWIRYDHSHHWPTVTAAGDILAPIARIERDEPFVAATRQPTECAFGAFYEDGVRVLSPDGEERAEFWFRDAVIESDRQGIAYAVRDDCDPYHVNGLDVLNEAAAARVPGARPGDIVASLRSSSALVVLDQDTGDVLRVVSGPMVAQHSPNVTPDGDVVLFDNLGRTDAEGPSRILAIDLATEGARTLFPVDPSAPGGDLNSEAEGAVSLSRDARFALIAETLGGRVIEVDLVTGEAHWIYRSQSELGAYLAFDGRESDGRVVGLMQTQGAEYITFEDFERFSAGAR